MSGQVGIPDREHAWTQYPAARVLVPLQIPEMLQRMGDTLRRALGDVGRGRDLSQRERPAVTAEGAQNAKRLLN